MDCYYAVASGALPSPLRVATVFTVSNYMIPSLRSLLDLRVLSKVLNPAHVPGSLGRLGTTAVGRPPSKRAAAMLASLFDIANPGRVSSVRQAEDSRACAAMSATQVLLGLEDSQLRRPKAVLDPAWPLGGDAKTLTRVEEGARDLIRSLRPAVVVCPWPHGGVQHLDHRLVYAACAAATSSEQVPLWFLDDLPYGRRPLVPTYNPEKDTTYVPRLVRASEAMRRNKHLVMDLYASQWSEAYHRAVDEAPPGEAGPSETLWLPG